MSSMYVFTPKRGVQFVKFYWLYKTRIGGRSYSSTTDNRPFYSCRFSDLASEWQWGWGWPCFDTDLYAFIVQIKLFLC